MMTWKTATFTRKSIIQALEKRCPGAVHTHKIPKGTHSSWWKWLSTTTTTTTTRLGVDSMVNQIAFYQEANKPKQHTKTVTETLTLLVRRQSRASCQAGNIQPRRDKWHTKTANYPNAHGWSSWPPTSQCSVHTHQDPHSRRGLDCFHCFHSYVE